MAQRTGKGQDAESKRLKAIFDEGEALAKINKEEMEIKKANLSVEVIFVYIIVLFSNTFTDF
jgi:hypothetical protein